MSGESTRTRTGQLVGQGPESDRRRTGVALSVECKHVTVVGIVRGGRRGFGLGWPSHTQAILYGVCKTVSSGNLAGMAQLLGAATDDAKVRGLFMTLRATAARRGGRFPARTLRPRPQLAPPRSITAGRPGTVADRVTRPPSLTTECTLGRPRPLRAGRWRAR